MIREKIETYLMDIGASVELMLTILVFVVALIISTRDLRIGLLVAFLLYAAEFIALSTLGYDVTLAVAGMLLSFAFLTISLLIKRSEKEVW